MASKTGAVSYACEAVQAALAFFRAGSDSADTDASLRHLAPLLLLCNGAGNAVAAVLLYHELLCGRRVHSCYLEAVDGLVRVLTAEGLAADVAQVHAR